MVVVSRQGVMVSRLGVMVLRLGVVILMLGVAGMLGVTVVVMVSKEVVIVMGWEEEQTLELLEESESVEELKEE